MGVFQSCSFFRRLAKNIYLDLLLLNKLTPIKKDFLVCLLERSRLFIDRVSRSARRQWKSRLTTKLSCGYLRRRINRTDTIIQNILFCFLLCLQSFINYTDSSGVFCSRFISTFLACCGLPSEFITQGNFSCGLVDSVFSLCRGRLRAIYIFICGRQDISCTDNVLLTCKIYTNLPYGFKCID